MISVTAQLKGIEKVDLLKKKTEKVLWRLLREAARAVKEQAIANTTRVDTGAMKAAWYVGFTGTTGDYTKSVAAAKALYATKYTTAFPALSRVHGSRPSEVVIANAAAYAVYHEYGTARIAATPMLAPAIEAVKPKLKAMLREALREGGSPVEVEE